MPKTFRPHTDSHLPNDQVTRDGEREEKSKDPSFSRYDNVAFIRSDIHHFTGEFGVDDPRGIQQTSVLIVDRRRPFHLKLGGLKKYVLRKYVNV